MLYGYKEHLDDRIATIVPAASTTEEYDAWVEAVVALDPSAPEVNFNETYASSLLDHMMRDEYKGYKRSVLAVYHDSEEQRDAFFAEYNIKEVNSYPARDKQLDMIHKDQLAEDQAREEAQRCLADALGEEYRDKTIAEIAGIDKEDPWDKRTDAQKAADEQEQIQMAEMRKNGKLTDDSFGSAKQIAESREDKEDDGSLKIDDVHASFNPDGTIDIADITGHKYAPKTPGAPATPTPAFDLFSDDDYESISGSDKDSSESKASESPQTATDTSSDDDEGIIENDNALSANLPFNLVVENKHIPNDVRELLEEMGTDIPDSVLWDTLPPASRIGGNVVIPSGHIDNPAVPYIIGSAGLEPMGSITLDGYSLAVFQPQDDVDQYVIFEKKSEDGSVKLMILKIIRP